MTFHHGPFCQVVLLLPQKSHNDCPLRSHPTKAGTALPFFCEWKSWLVSQGSKSYERLSSMTRPQTGCITKDMPIVSAAKKRENRIARLCKLDWQFCSLQATWGGSEFLHYYLTDSCIHQGLSLLSKVHPPKLKKFHFILIVICLDAVISKRNSREISGLSNIFYWYKCNVYVSKNKLFNKYNWGKTQIEIQLNTLLQWTLYLCTFIPQIHVFLFVLSIFCIFKNIYAHMAFLLVYHAWNLNMCVLQIMQIPLLAAVTIKQQLLLV